MQDLSNAVNHALQQLEIPALSLPTTQDYIGDGVRKLLERALKNPDTALLDRGMRYFREFYTAHLFDYTSLYPGALAALDFFSSKHKVLLTNKPTEYAVPLVSHLKLEPYFSTVLGGDSQYGLKPDPAGILAMVEKYRVDPERTLMIGDSKNDILAGQNAGVQTCAVTFGFRTEAQLRPLRPTYVINALDELRNIVI